MSQNTQSIRFEIFIKAPPAQVYEAFTNATSLREWMCDIATVDPKPGGRIYAAWNSGFYAMGEYIHLQPNEEISFTWHGRGEPAFTKIEIHLKEHEDGTTLLLEHQQVGTSSEWINTRSAIQAGWESGLENLASVLETGEDLRFTHRPMLGIGVSDFNEEIAHKLNVPVSKGIRIDSTVEGMGAKAAGLQHNDVIVGMDGQDIVDGAGFGTILQSHRAGDKIPVEFYRGPEKKNILMELSKRPIPPLPASIAELAEFARKRQEEIHVELDEFFLQVSEEEASYKPAPEEWSVKETLAHLIQGERYFQFWVIELAGRQEAHHDDWAGNILAGVQALVVAQPTFMELRQAYKRSTDESVALLSHLPPEFQQHKGTYWRLAYGIVEDPFHHRIHLDQMRAAVEAARKG
jgi:uncharacterized protein YndB with AHSA1/START domain